MGNIISNTSGNTSTVNGAIGTDIFSQHMNDILLELNLYNTGNYDVGKDMIKSSPVGPRDEFNFASFAGNTNKVTLAPSGITSSADTGNISNRPMNSNNQYVDIIGLPYVTNEQQDPTWSQSQLSSGFGSNTGGAYAIAANNQYYNIKRAICNSSTVAPVDIIGVDIPADDPDMSGFTSSALTSDQKNVLSIPKTNTPGSSTSISKMVDNCLTYGTIDNKTVAGSTAAIVSKIALDNFTSIKGLTCWLDGADPLGTGIAPTPGAKISTWNDKSANKINATQTSATLQPTFVTGGGVSFNKTNKTLLSIGLPTLTSGTVFFVLSPHTGNSAAYLYDSTNNTSVLLTYTTDGVINPFTLWNYSTPTPPNKIFLSGTAPSMNLIDFTMTANNSINGNYNGVSAFNLPSITSTNPLTIKSIGGNAAGDCYTGTLYEVIIYDKVLTDSETKTVQMYLNDKWKMNVVTLALPNSYINQNPDIPDLTSKNGLLLNDYSNITQNSSSGKFSPHNIYDNNLEPACVTLLNSMVFNSYITADIKKYTKWSDAVKKSGITTDTASGYAFIHEPSTGFIDLNTYDPAKANTYDIATEIQKKYPTSANIYAQNKGVVTTTAQQTDMNDTCKNFENDLCQWYYYYDIEDGLNHNVSSPITQQNGSKFINNIYYLNQHIPDCKCDSYKKLTEGNSNSGASGDFTGFYGALCQQSFNYGPANMNINGSNVNYSYTSSKNNSLKVTTMPLYDVNSANKFTGYRRQWDPVLAAKTSRYDTIYGVIPGSIRSQANTVNNYTCNMNFEPNIGNVGGNVVIGNINMSCGTGTQTACKGDWQNAPNAKCSAVCDPTTGAAAQGTIDQVYVVSTPAANGGSVCMAADPNGSGAPAARQNGDKGTKTCSSGICNKEDCLTSQGPWSACVNGSQSATLTITSQPKYGGTKCPTNLTVTQSCVVPPPPPNPVPCVGSWSEWSACSTTACGTSGTQTRTYTLTTAATGGGNATCPLNGAIETRPCTAPACPAVNCGGNWVTPSTSSCSSTTCGTPGTIQQYWVTTVAASNGGTACPSSSTMSAPCNPTGCPDTGTTTGGAISLTGNNSNSSSCTTLCPTITQINLLDPSQTVASYSKPLEATTPLINTGTTIQVTMNINDALVANFVKNYNFLLVLSSNPDPTKGFVCPFIGSACSSLTGSCSPYTLTIPFMYGTSSGTNKYQLVLVNKPDNYSNPITPKPYSIPLTLKQYSFTISSINITTMSGNPYMAIGINLNTTDTLPAIGVRIVLTPKTGSSPVLTQSYTNIQTILNSNNGFLTIGSNQQIQSISYTYSVMVNETITKDTLGNNVYSGGNQLNYDSSFPVTSQGTVSFSQISSVFTNVSMQYMDYNNDNSILNVIPNDTLLIGSTILFSWVISSVDSGLSTVKIYYDINSTYIPSSTVSASSVLLQSSSLGSLNQATNNYTNTINFICPFVPTLQPVIFYAVASGSSSNVYSTPIKVSLPNVTGSSYIANWQVITNNTTSDMTTIPTTSLTPVLATNQTTASINNYFTAGKNASNSYVIYNPTDNKWYGSDATPTPVSSTTSSVPKYTIFKSPYTITPIPTISITSITSSVTGTTNSVYTSSTSGSITLELGAELTLNYQITNLPFDTNFQLIIANKTITNFTVRKVSTSPPQITFSVFGDLTVQNPTLVLTSYGTWSSRPIPIVLNNKGALKKILNAATATPASSVTFTTITNPAINVVAPNSDNTIVNMSVSYATMIENQYFTQLSSFSTPLTINNATFKYGVMNFNLPFSLIIHSSATEGYKNIESFTNPHQMYLESKLPKKQSTNKPNFNINSNMIESYTENLTSTENTITINTLTLDFSSSTLETLNNIQLMFSGYTRVNIQNLILIFGTLALDNKKFNISIVSNSVTTTDFAVSTLTFIGNLSGKIYLTNTIPGLTTVNYSVNQKVNNNYALLSTLVYSNSSYSLPENYQSQLNNILNPPVTAAPIVNPVVPPVIITPAPSSSDNTMTIVIIVIVVIFLIIGGYLAYTLFFANKAIKK
jgi:hypothetical protein